MDTEGNLLLITIEGIDGTGKSTLLAGSKASLRISIPSSPGNRAQPGWVNQCEGQSQSRSILSQKLHSLLLIMLRTFLPLSVRPITRQTCHIGPVQRQPFCLPVRDAQRIVPDPEGWLRAMHDGWSIVPDRTFLLVLSIDDALARLADKSGANILRSARCSKRCRIIILHMPVPNPHGL